MKALLSLEVKFAALRDRLYVERMEETAAEEAMILNGQSRRVNAFRETSADALLRESPCAKFHVQEPAGTERAAARSRFQTASSSAGRIGQSPRGREGMRVDMVDRESTI